MDKDLQKALGEELRPGEKLIWSGGCMGRVGQQGKAGGPYVGTAIGVFVPSIIGLLLTGVTNSGIPFLIAIVVSLIAARWAYKHSKRYPDRMYKRKRSIYAITDRRVVAILDLHRDRRVKSIPFRMLGSMQIRPPRLPDPSQYPRPFRRFVRQPQADANVPLPKGTIEFWTDSQESTDEVRAPLRFIMIEHPEWVVEQVEKLRYTTSSRADMDVPGA